MSVYYNMKIKQCTQKADNLKRSAHNRLPSIKNTINYLNNEIITTALNTEYFQLVEYPSHQAI